MYVDVIVPLPLNTTFTYRLPEEFFDNVRVGVRVIVPFGAKKLNTGIVISLHEELDESSDKDIVIKDVLEVLDNGTPVVNATQIKFWQWMAHYYVCSQGDVMKAALPAGLKMESESILMLADEDVDTDNLNQKEQLVVEKLREKKEWKIQDLQKAFVGESIMYCLSQLLDKSIVVTKEELRRNYRPRTEVHLRLSPNYFDDTKLNQWLDKQRYLNRKKRSALLTDFLVMVKADAAFALKNYKILQTISRKEFCEKSGYSSAMVKVLVDEGILETFELEIGRLKTDFETSASIEMPLSNAQTEAYEQIERSFSQKPICLLHGVTSSGKTEIYIRLIQKAISEGRQVLYLLPEIALTTQITTRLRRIFGSRLGVYHSKFPDAERVEVWQKQCSSVPYDVILGVRSSLFLPFQNLGLIIVDEEHETSYKQQDPAPRYNARDAAIVLSKFYDANTLLGTATPSLESYYNALQGKYGLVSLTSRFGDVCLPNVEVVDVADLRRRKLMKTPFSPRLIEEIKASLDVGEQVILFQNRRGYSPVIECRSCGWVPRCSKCDVSLTYHQEQQRLVCHYCGSNYSIPTQCPNCKDTELREIGYGTERIEEVVKATFPNARTARMDLDTTRSRTAYEQIIADFQSGQTNILIGTQMVTKGLDFDRVHVVGILNADTMLNIPDFRSYERAFQMMSQVAGRAGRRGKQGIVILQTKNVELPVISQVVHNDFVGMYSDQMEERELFHYPPFYRLIGVYLKHRDPHVVDEASMVLASSLRATFGERILGPDRPSVSRVQLQYIRCLLIKIETVASPSKVREILSKHMEWLKSQAKYKSLTIYYDVDPL